MEYLKKDESWWAYSPDEQIAPAQPFTIPSPLECEHQPDALISRLGSAVEMVLLC